MNNLALRLSLIFANIPPFIAFIAVAVRSLIIVPTAAAMGQLKWHYFRRGQKIKQLETIDRGTWGFSGATGLLMSKGVLSMSFTNSTLKGAMLTLFWQPSCHAWCGHHPRHTFLRPLFPEWNQPRDQSKLPDHGGAVSGTRRDQGSAARRLISRCESVRLLHRGGPGKRLRLP